MAHTKSAGAAKRTVNVAGKRLGFKKFGGENVKPGDIILRQRGTKFHAGLNTGLGRDHTIYSVASGFVYLKQMTGFRRDQKLVMVTPENRYVPTKKVITPKVEKVETKPTKPAVKVTKKASAKTSTKVKVAAKK